MSLIKFKRGLKLNLPVLAVGEPALTTDTREFFIGTSAGNLQMGDMLKSTYDANGDGVVDNAAALNGQAASYYLSRDNHTGTQLASTISDFQEAAQDAIGALVTNSSTVSFTYDDNAGTLIAAVVDGSISTTKLMDGAVNFNKLANGLVETSVEGLSASDVVIPTSKAVKDVTDALDSRLDAIEGGTLNTEAVQDIVGSTFVDSATIDFTYDDTANTMTGAIIDGSITTAKLADDSVTAAKVAADVAGAALVQNGISGALDVNVDGTTIEITSDALNVKDLGISTDKLADGAVTPIKLADGSVIASKIVDGSVLTSKIADANVTTDKIADANVTEAKLADSSVTNSKLADSSVSAFKLDNTIAGEGLYRNGVTGALEVSADTVTIEVVSDQVSVKDLGISTAKLADSAVTTAKIADDNVTTAKLADSAVTTAKLADGNVTFAKLASSDIETDLNASAASNKLVTAAAAKAYADGIASGVSVKQAVRVATTGPITLSNVTTVIDGVTLADGDRVLVKDQANAVDNGVYVWNVGGAMTRAADFDDVPDYEIDGGEFVFVQEGTANADAGFVLVSDAPVVVGTDNLVFTQFSGAGQITDGDGLTKVGNTLNVNVDGVTMEITADQLNVKDLGISTAKLADGAVTTAKIADANVTTAKLADDSVTAAKVAADVAGAALIQNGTTGALDVNVDGTTIEINADAIRVRNGGITETRLADGAVTTLKLANLSVTTAKLVDSAVTTVKIADANVTEAKLADSAVTTVKIADANVTEAKLATAAVTSTKIADANVTTAKIADANVTTAKLADDSVTAAKVAADVAGAALVQNGTTGALDVNVDNSSIKISGDAIYVDLVDGGTF